MAKISGIDFVTLLVSNLETSYHFYTEKVGLTASAERQPNAYAFSMKPSAFAIRQAPSEAKMNKPGQGIILWLKTTDAIALHGDFVKQGITIVEELRKGPFGMTFSFLDPDGYILAVHDGG